MLLRAGSARLGRRRGGCRVLPRDHRGTDPVRETGADWQIATAHAHRRPRTRPGRRRPGARPRIPATFLFEHAGPHLAGRRLTGLDRGPVPCRPTSTTASTATTTSSHCWRGRTRKSWSSSAAGPDPHPRCRHGGQPTGAVRRLPPARQQPSGYRAVLGHSGAGTSIRSTCGC